MPRIEVLQIHFVETFSAAWFFSLGAIFGSFLNVVVYRMPRGSEVIFRPSACPYCTARIKPRDNLPVLGWMLLGGRCRACRLRISPRYPLVEFVTALIFLTLYFFVIWSGGQMLPLRSPDQQVGALSNLFSPHWELITTYAFLCWLMCHLLATSLINGDGYKVPARLVVFSTLVGFITPIVAPAVHIIPVFTANTPLRVFLDRIDVGMVGLLAGTALGVILLGIDALTKQDSRPANIVSAMGVAGLYLGWQAAMAVTVITLVTEVIRRLFVSGFPLAGRIPMTGSVAASVLIHLLSWRWSYGLSSFSSVELLLSRAFAEVLRN